MTDPAFTVDQARALGDWVASKGRNLTDIFITHGHGDHWFAAELLAQRFDARIVAAAGTVAQMHASIALRPLLWDKAYPGIPPMEIERGGDTVATIKKALVSPLRDRFSIDLKDGNDLSAKGNVVDHEYEIERDGHKIAQISKRWFRVRDPYGIEVAPGEDDALIVAAAVCIDEMTGD